MYKNEPIEVWNAEVIVMRNINYDIKSPVSKTNISCGG